jgi:hypothetical protein
MAKITRTQGASKYLDQRLAELDKFGVGAGWFKSSVYANGKPVAYIASIHEFGYAPKNIPPRLGLRQLVVDQGSHWLAIAGELSKRVLNDQMNVRQALDVIGQTVASSIQKRISDVTEPALKPSTLKERASRLGIPVSELSGTGAKPLVEPKQADGSAGGYMLATVQYLVMEKSQAGEKVE